MTIEPVDVDPVNEDRTDRAARSLSERLPGSEPFDVAIGLRLIRAGQLVAASWGVDPTASVEHLARHVGPGALTANNHALRYLADLDRQDLVELLRAVTVGLGDLPGSDRSDLLHDQINREDPR